MPRPYRSGLASARRGPATGRRVDAGRRRELLSQLQDVVFSEGFAQLTVDDLAARLQCSKSTLYAISSSKEQLVVAVVKNFFRTATDNIAERVAHIDDPGPRVASYLNAVGVEMSRMSPACYQDMVSHEATREIYALNSLAAARRVREYISEGVTDGSFRAVHAEFVGQAVSLLIDGIQHGELLEQTGLTSGQAYAELGDLVLAALTNKADSPDRCAERTSSDTS